MDTILALITLMNAATPGAVKLFLMIKEEGGSTSVIGFLDERDGSAGKAKKQVADWLAANPAQP